MSNLNLPGSGRNKPSSSLVLALTLLAGLGLILSGCGTKKTAFSGKGSPIYSKSGPLPKGGGRYKIGSPYKILNKWYTPRENPNYNRVGTASWYGPKFHRRMTANGEWFDMNRMTAAHPTLPLPVFARVTNLKNGRTIVVRINDRGPYSHNREIDLSRAAAKKLGFIRAGTAKVRVKYLGKAPLSKHASNYYGQSLSRNLYARAPLRKPRHRKNFAHPGRVGPVEPLGPARPPVTRAASRQPSQTRGSEALYVQAASYSNRDNAERARHNLAALGRVEMTRIDVGQRAFFRVRVGPLRNPQAARSTLTRVVDAGHGDARIVAD